jgi:hypothetical protein
VPTVDESVSQAIDVFHLPSGVDVSDYEIYEVATSDGVKRLRYPRLDGSKVTSLAKQLVDVRNRTLAAMSTIFSTSWPTRPNYGPIRILSCGVRLNC